MDFPFQLVVKARLMRTSIPAAWRCSCFPASTICRRHGLRGSCCAGASRSLGKQPVAWTFPVRGLVLLCCLPSIITASFNLFARVHLTTHWAIPAWFALPVTAGGVVVARRRRRVCLETLRAWPGRFRRGIAGRRAALHPRSVDHRGSKVFPGAPGNGRGRLKRVCGTLSGAGTFLGGGSWPESGALAFFSPSHPRALPGFPDERRALVNPYQAWQARYGVIICYASGAYAREGSHDTECEPDPRLAALPSVAARGRNPELSRRGLAVYPRPAEERVTVFWIQPARENCKAVSDRA